MTSNESGTQPTNQDQIQTIGTALALQNFGYQLVKLQEQLDSYNNKIPSKTSAFIEFCKLLFGGWPALGFLFLLLFYSPLKEALDAIPNKVRDANEFTALGVSFKSTIKREVDKLGDMKLSESIPGLSNAAIESLLRASRTSEALVSYSVDDNQKVYAIHFPSSTLLLALSELQSNGLIEIETTGNQNLTGETSSSLITNFKIAHPGREDFQSDNKELRWELDVPLDSHTDVLQLSWKLTDLGVKAVEVILNAISSVLNPEKSQ